MAINPEKSRKQAIARKIRKEILRQRLEKATPYEKARYIQKRLKMQKKGYIRADQITEFKAVEVATLFPEAFVISPEGYIKARTFIPQNGNEEISFYWFGGQNDTQRKNGAIKCRFVNEEIKLILEDEFPNPGLYG